MTQVPCAPCTTIEGCTVVVPANCVTIKNTTLDEFVECNSILNHFYNCIVANPDQYIKFCQLWAACGQPCLVPTNLVIQTNTTGINGVKFSWQGGAGSTYNIYLDNVLTFNNATSPVVFPINTVTPLVTHTAKVVQTCSNGGTSQASLDFILCKRADTFAVNVGASTSTTAVVTWTTQAGHTYDLYRNGTLVQMSASTPYTYTGLTPSTQYNFTITSQCGGVPDSYSITYTTAP